MLTYFTSIPPPTFSPPLITLWFLWTLITMFTYFTPFSPPLISLMVSVDVKHYVYLLHPLLPAPNKPDGFCGRQAPCLLTLLSLSTTSTQSGLLSYLAKALARAEKATNLCTTIPLSDPYQTADTDVSRGEIKKKKKKKGKKKIT